MTSLLFFRRLTLGAALVCGLGTAVSAQTTQVAAALHVRATAAGEGPMDSVFASFKPGFEVRAAKDDSNVSLRFGTPVDNYRFLSFTGSVPVDKNSSTTSIATLDGFSKALSAELKFSNFWGTGPDGLLLASAAPAEDTDLERRTKMFVAQGAGRVVTAASVTLSDEAREILKRTKLFSFSAKIGSKDFTYLVNPTLANGKKRETVYGGRIALADYHWDEKAISVDFEYQDTFEAAASKSFALAPDSNGLQEVKTGSFGPPKKSLKRLYSVEYRWRQNIFSAPNGGISVKVTWDEVADQVGIKVPVYFIQSAGEGAIGGVEFGWTNKAPGDADKFTIGLVIGGAVKLRPW